MSLEKPKIKVLRSKPNKYLSSNIVLKNGQLFYYNLRNKFYVGDGKTTLGNLVINGDYADKSTSTSKIDLTIPQNVPNNEIRFNIGVESYSKKINNVQRSIESNSTNHIKINSVKSSINLNNSYWKSKSWTGLTSFNGKDVWSDGDNTYCSNYLLNKKISSWNSLSWNNITNFNASNVWTDGRDIYYTDTSNINNYRYLEFNTNSKTWLSSSNLYGGVFQGKYIWSDGHKIYYSYENNQYYISLANNRPTWTAMTWTGLTNFYGNYIWTDGYNVYYSYSQQGKQYKLNLETNSWTSIQWYDIEGNNLNNSIDGDCIWTDGNDIYYSKNNTHYYLDKSTNCWVNKKWLGLGSNPYFSGSNIWTDNNNIYLSSGTNQYELEITNNK